VEQLVEDLGGRTLAAELTGNRGDGGLEHRCEPAAGDRHLGDRVLALPLEVDAVGRDVVEEPAGLVLLGVEPGEMEQTAPVMSRLNYLRVEVESIAPVGCDELDLVDVEAELVETAQTLLQPEPLGRSEDLGVG